MGGNSFERIMQEIAIQKQLLEDLSAENTLLRGQLADLREGRGMVVEIDGQRYALASTAVSQLNPTALDTLANKQISQNSQATVGMIYSVTPETPLVLDNIPDILVGTTPQPQPYSEPDPEPYQSFNTPLPAVDEQTWGQNTEIPDQQEQEIPVTPITPSFLEDMLVDEFTDAATFQMAARKRPDPKKFAAIDEEEKATLRKELMGSFLLE